MHTYPWEYSLSIHFPKQKAEIIGVKKIHQGRGYCLWVKTEYYTSIIALREAAKIFQVNFQTIKDEIDRQVNADENKKSMAINAFSNKSYITTPSAELTQLLEKLI